MCMGFVCTVYTPDAHRIQKRVLDPLVLELEMVRHHVGARNQTVVLFNHRAIFQTRGFFFLRTLKEYKQNAVIPSNVFLLV